MKKLFALLLAVVLVSGCAATYDGPTQTKYALTEYTVTHFYTFFDWEEESYTNRTVYAYDIYGNRVREMEYRDGELESVTNMKYDDRGNLISERRWDHSRFIPLPDGSQKFTYDDQDRLLTTRYFDGWGRQTSSSSYTYDDEAMTSTWRNDQGDSRTSWLDEEGREIRALAGEYETVYEYDDLGNRISWVSYKNGVFFDSYEARYDDQGRQIWGGRYNTQGELEHETTWEFDDEAHTMTTRRPDGQVRYQYFDAEGRLHMIEDYDETGELTMVQRYYYTQIRVPATGKEKP